ncbi:MAG: DUF3046 domain-containing protein [Buchananella hordeovulneris]|nr:DUF3046 domain-containing protein [Buchananella hordeovulneris]
MRQSEFRSALERTFGEVLGPSYAQDVHLPEFGSSAAQALEADADPLEVWHALCDALDRPDAKWAHREDVKRRRR